MIYGVPLASNFAELAVAGLMARYADPAALARVKIIVNSARFARLLKEALSKETILLPKIYTLDGFLKEALPWLDLKTDQSQIHHVLSIVELLEGLSANQEIIQEIIAERSHFFELAFNLVELLNQCAEREISPDALLELDLSEYAEHWQLNAQFFQILASYWHEAKAGHHIHNRLSAIDMLQDYWRDHPPEHPVLIMGSTGSRPLMRRFMKAVISCPQGKIIIPAVDFDLDQEITEDHPQFGAYDLSRELDCEIELWAGDEKPKGALLRTAMAPAPYTNLWLDELDNTRNLLQSDPLDLSYIRAENGHDEARALAVLIHECVSARKRVLLASNDRVLIRRLCGRLRHLGIEYDDSSGAPLHLSPAGLYASLTLDAITKGDAVSIVALLSHPFVFEHIDRARHLRALRWLDKEVLRQYSGSRFWERAKESKGADQYSNWLGFWEGLLKEPRAQKLGAWLNWHLDLMVEISGAEDWKKLASDGALFDAMYALSLDDESQLDLTLEEYIRFWRAWILRLPSQPLPPPEGAMVKILGHIEARIESADCVIFAAMNEGQWPSAEIPDMWLNRQIRRELGLEVPERFIGLAAHDFMSGFSAPSLVISRALKEGGVPTIESRFVTRLRVLANGADESFWKKVEARGDRLLEKGKGLDHFEKAVDPEPRPSPVVLADTRPKGFSATALEKLVQNPYHYYAEKLLKLKNYARLGEDMSARQAGLIVHNVFEKLSADFKSGQTLKSEAYSQAIDEALGEEKLDALELLSIRTEFDRLEAVFLPDENARREWADKILTEVDIYREFQGVKLSARMDRLDVNDAGSWRLYDYKSGRKPYDGVSFSSEKAQQLPIMAMMLAAGEYGDKADEIAVLRYRLKENSTPGKTKLKDFDFSKFQAEFAEFIEHIYRDGFGYAAHYEENDFNAAFDHLARYGEWLENDAPLMMELGK